MHYDGVKFLAVFRISVSVNRGSLGKDHNRRNCFKCVIFSEGNKLGSQKVSSVLGLITEGHYANPSPLSTFSFKCGRED